jgi:hypothetical protein
MLLSLKRSSLSLHTVCSNKLNVLPFIDFRARKSSKPTTVKNNELLLFKNINTLLQGFCNAIWRDGLVTRPVLSKKNGKKALHSDYESIDQFKCLESLYI